MKKQVFIYVTKVVSVVLGLFFMPFLITEYFHPDLRAPLGLLVGLVLGMYVLWGTEYKSKATKNNPK